MNKSDVMKMQAQVIDEQGVMLRITEVIINNLLSEDEIIEEDEPVGEVDEVPQSTQPFDQYEDEVYKAVRYALDACDFPPMGNETIDKVLGALYTRGYGIARVGAA